MGRDRRKRAGRRAGPFRTCLGCRRRRPQAQTLRVVCGPGGQVLPDLFAKLPGRGAHLCPDAACFQRAAERRAFSRAFRTEVRPVDVGQLVEAFCRAGRSQWEALLATAARCGWLQPGRSEVLAGLAGGRTALVLLAEDASAQLVEELERRCARISVPSRRILDKEALARFHRGKPLAVLGLAHRGLAGRLIEEIDRTRELLDSVRNQGDTALRELTAGEVRGMMPQTRAGPA